jgi:hypothetical protein
MILIGIALLVTWPKELYETCEVRKALGKGRWKTSGGALSYYWVSHGYR